MVRPAINIFHWKPFSKIAMGPPGVTSTFFLWIDEVGGYLVCPQPTVTVGHLDSSEADVAISGDLESRHLTLTREDDLYVLEAHGPVSVGGRPVRRTILPERCVLELGNCVRLEFLRPHPLSASARIDFVSGHRTVPSTDGVLLMARNIILGPEKTSHVVCPSWKESVTLYWVGDTLCCRGSSLLTVDGKVVRGEATLTLRSHVEGVDWRFHLEPA
ncbi:hypothetical protein [Thermogutta sp.]|uniref:hypothetical protein n=2 Tax=Thermogutta sp. TaxID=1962930 RepID=UPI0032208F1D